MESRRDFLKKAAMLSGAAAMTAVPDSVRRALAIDPETGSTYLDAEHVVILMQENRSFDHCYGSLQGVRGFNDPRAHVKPDGNPVWLQTNKRGETYAPFRLDIHETNATWTGSLPHSWADQVDARNHGRYDRWLDVKPSGYKGLADKPMTLGYYTREDIPFYYAFADAFTICDQHFCSSLTGTTPNRLYLWSGTIRAEQKPDSKPHVYNEEADFGTEVSWKTFPERLEDAGISWKVYQNEVTIDTGFKGEGESWLSNFGDNPLEYFLQFGVRYAPRHRAFLEKRLVELGDQLAIEVRNAALRNVKAELAAEMAKRREALRDELKSVREELTLWSQEKFDRLSQRDKSLHLKAFSTNESDPHFRDLETLTYRDGLTERQVQVPKGDVFHQFREDVRSGNLPTVSWIVGPENFSDHPSSAWYGAWYVSEALDILTQNTEVWKKTIFILTYDENDGYFDHVPPFVAPDPARLETGKVSEGIDAAVEYVTLEQDKAFRPKYSPRDSSIGLGYRVPMVVASPWSRGGCVCSQVFDHTSVLQLLEKVLTHKTGRRVEEPKISSWRRAVCGDLTSIFQPWHGEASEAPPFPSREVFVEGIHRAQFKSPPTGFKALSATEIEAIRSHPAGSSLLPSQEFGTRYSCPLPYEFYADGALSSDRTKFEVRLRVGKDAFGQRAAGSAFNAYSYDGVGGLQVRAYAVSAGKAVGDSWTVSGSYHLRVDGPNGFLREFRGSRGDPDLEVMVGYEKSRSKALTGSVAIEISNPGVTALAILVEDLSYGKPAIRAVVGAGARARIVVDTSASSGWYDFGIRVEGRDGFYRRCAGRVETGRWGITDPATG